MGVLPDNRVAKGNPVEESLLCGCGGDVSMIFGLSRDITRRRLHGSCKQGLARLGFGALGVHYLRKEIQLSHLNPRN